MFTITITSYIDGVVFKETHTNFDAAHDALHMWAGDNDKNVWSDNEVGVYGLFNKTGGTTHKARITW